MNYRIPGTYKGVLPLAAVNKIPLQDKIAALQDLIKRCNYVHTLPGLNEPAGWFELAPGLQCCVDYGGTPLQQRMIRFASRTMRSCDVERFIEDATHEHRRRLAEIAQFEQSFDD
jgi:hypothetical protein